ncbi:MAG: DEAD/DEAH box helicase, partial [Segetibacter sp.]
HRIGRTARAESNGTAFTLINEKEQKKFAAIEALIGKIITKAVVPESFGPAPIYNPNINKASHKRTFNRKNKSA